MSVPSSPNGNESDSNVQRILIGAGTLVVVVLTVIIAVFLTFQEVGEPTPSPTEVAVSTATPTITLTPQPPPVETPTNTPLPPPPTETPLPPPPPTDTPTPLPPPPTVTFTPLPPEATEAPPSEPTTSSEEEGSTALCQPRPGWVEYTAQIGDTYDSLATRTGTTVIDLLEVNCPDTATLAPGEVIYLPITPPTPTPTFTPTSTSLPNATPTRTPTPVSPEIDSVAPRQADEGHPELIMTVLGNNFFIRGAGFRAELRGPQNVPLKLREITLSEISFEAIVPPNLPLGTYDLVVTNPDGKSDIERAALTIGDIPTPTPTATPIPLTIQEFFPETGKASEEVVITIEGTGFKPNEGEFKIELQPVNGGSIVEFQPDNATSTILQIRIPPNTLNLGDYRIIVFNNSDDFESADENYSVIN